MRNLTLLRAVKKRQLKTKVNQTKENEADTVTEIDNEPSVSQADLDDLAQDEFLAAKRAFVIR